MRRFETENPVSPAFGLAPRPGRPLVADLAARAGRRAGKRRYRGRVVVRLDLHQDVRRLEVVSVVAGRARIEALDARALHHGGVVRIRHHACPRDAGDACRESCRTATVLRLAVDDPARVEDLVPAVLGVGLREHHQLDVGRIAARASRSFRAGSRSRRRTARDPCRGSRAPAQRARRRARRSSRAAAGGIRWKSCARFLERCEHGLGHAVVQERQRSRAGARNRGAIRRRSSCV